MEGTFAYRGNTARHINNGEASFILALKLSSVSCGGWYPLKRRCNTIISTNQIIAVLSLLLQLSFLNATRTSL